MKEKHGRFGAICRLCSVALIIASISLLLLHVAKGNWPTPPLSGVIWQIPMKGITDLLLQFVWGGGGNTSMMKREIGKLSLLVFIAVFIGDLSTGRPAPQVEQTNRDISNLAQKTRFKKEVPRKQMERPRKKSRESKPRLSERDLQPPWKFHRESDAGRISRRLAPNFRLPHVPAGDQDVLQMVGQYLSQNPWLRGPA